MKTVAFLAVIFLSCGGSAAVAQTITLQQQQAELSYLDGQISRLTAPGAGKGDSKWLQALQADRQRVAGLPVSSGGGGFTGNLQGNMAQMAADLQRAAAQQAADQQRANEQIARDNARIQGMGQRGRANIDAAANNALDALNRLEASERPVTRSVGAATLDGSNQYAQDQAGVGQNINNLMGKANDPSSSTAAADGISPGADLRPDVGNSSVDGNVEPTPRPLSNSGTDLPSGSPEADAMAAKDAYQKAIESGNPDEIAQAKAQFDSSMTNAAKTPTPSQSPAPSDSATERPIPLQSGYTTYSGVPDPNGKLTTDPLAGAQAPPAGATTGSGQPTAPGTGAHPSSTDINGNNPKSQSTPTMQAEKDWQDANRKRALDKVKSFRPSK